jgi:hypothetical protein
MVGQDRPEANKHCAGEGNCPGLVVLTVFCRVALLAGWCDIGKMKFA